MVDGLTDPGIPQPHGRGKGQGGDVLERAPAGRRLQRGRPPKLYRIGEVVDYSGVSRQTIHNYTTMGLLHESRWTAGGHRLYDEEVFERLDRIEEFKAASKSLQDIRDYFVKRELGAAGPGAAKDVAPSAVKLPGQS